jgi:phage terminase small subunit
MTPSQERFVEEYIIDLNAKQAYIRAGYGVTSGHSAESGASELLRNPEIAVAIEKAKARRSARTDIKADRVLQELARLGMSDARKLFNDDGSLKPVKEWDDDTAAAVASVEVFEEYHGKGEDKVLVGYTKKVKLWDKNSALEKIGRHLGMYLDRLEVMGKARLKIVEKVIDGRRDGHCEGDDLPPCPDAISGQ